MQRIESYKTNDALLRVLLQGDPKSGKTTMACQFPGAYIIDIDVNLAGPLRYLKSAKLPLPVGYDVVDHEDGKEIHPDLRYTRFSKLLTEASTNDEVKTIVIDSATGLVDLLLAETKRLQPGIKDQRQMFGFFFQYGKEFLTRLKTIRKHIVLVCHEKLEKNPDGSVILPYRVAWPGQLGHIIASFFTDVWRCEVLEKPTGLETKYEWVVKTMPNFQFKLGNSLGLPPVFKFDWKVIQERIDRL